MLSCATDGALNDRHNEGVLAWKEIFKRGSPVVRLEPRLRPVIDQIIVQRSAATGDKARGDIRVPSFKTLNRETFFDFSMIDTGTFARRKRSSEALLKDAEGEKRAKYRERIEPYGDFIPLIMSVYGMQGQEADGALSKAVRNGAHPDQHDATFMARMSIQFAGAKAVAECIQPPVADNHTGPEEPETEERSHPAGEVMEDPGIAAADSSAPALQ
jgi:hypothetical protein